MGIHLDLGSAAGCAWFSNGRPRRNAAALELQTSLAGFLPPIISIHDCIFSDAAWAAVNLYVSRARVEGCTFRNNNIDIFSDQFGAFLYTDTPNAVSLAPVSSSVRVLPLTRQREEDDLFSDDVNFTSLQRVRSFFEYVQTCACNVGNAGIPSCYADTRSTDFSMSCRKWASGWGWSYGTERSTERNPLSQTTSPFPPWGHPTRPNPSHMQSRLHSLREPSHASPTEATWACWSVPPSEELWRS